MSLLERWAISKADTDGVSLVVILTLISTSVTTNLLKKHAGLRAEQTVDKVRLLQKWNNRVTFGWEKSSEYCYTAQTQLLYIYVRARVCRVTRSLLHLILPVWYKCQSWLWIMFLVQIMLLGLSIKVTLDWPNESGLGKRKIHTKIELTTTLSFSSDISVSMKKKGNFCVC